MTVDNQDKRGGCIDMPTPAERDEVKTLVRDLPGSRELLLSCLQQHRERAPDDEKRYLAYLRALSEELSMSEREILARLALTGHVPSIFRERD